MSISYLRGRADQLLEGKEEKQKPDRDRRNWLQKLYSTRVDVSLGQLKGTSLQKMPVDAVFLAAHKQEGLSHQFFYSRSEKAFYLYVDKWNHSKGTGETSYMKINSKTVPDTLKELASKSKYAHYEE